MGSEWSRGRMIALIEQARNDMQRIVDRWEKGILDADVRNLEGPIAACNEAIEWWEKDNRRRG